MKTLSDRPLKFFTQFQPWQQPAKENVFPLQPSVLATLVTTAERIIHVLEVQSLCLWWGHQRAPKTACSNHLFLMSAFVHTSPFSQMGHFSHSDYLFSSPLSFSNPLLSPALAGLAVPFPFHLSCILCNNSHLHYNLIHPL